MNNKGTMEQKNKLIPELRFPEFVNDGEWEVNEVGNIFEITRGYVLSVTEMSQKQTEEYKYPVYSSQTKNNPSFEINLSKRLKNCIIFNSVKYS